MIKKCNVSNAISQYLENKPVTPKRASSAVHFPRCLIVMGIFMYLAGQHIFTINEESVVVMVGRGTFASHVPPPP